MNIPQTSPKGEQSKQLSENSERSPEVTHSGDVGSQNTILLQTAKVRLSNLILPPIAWLRDSYLMSVHREVI